MSEYNVADMKYYNEYKQATDEQASIYNYSFSEEMSLSVPEKIGVIDSAKDNFATKILNTAKEYTKDLESGVIKSTERFDECTPNINSLKAWLRRKQKKYDFGHMILCDGFYIGRIFIGNGKSYWLQSLTTENKRIEFINDVFHILLQNRANEERNYFFEHDELSVLKKEVIEHPMFNVISFPYAISSREGLLVHSGTPKTSRQPTIEELKTVLKEFNKVQVFVDCVGRELTKMFKENE